MAAPMDNVIEALRVQGKTCTELGSPFSGRVLNILAQDVLAEGSFARLMAPWGGASMQAIMDDAASLRILGGLHHLVLTGASPELAGQYPEHAPEPDWHRLQQLIPEAGRAHAPALAEFVKSPPQTNEVRRSLGLFGGFLTVAAETGLPLRCFEMGASAGLNLNWDRFRYDLGERGGWGDPGSSVRLSGDWSGGAPPMDVADRVVERAGCDRAPVDIADPDAALRLQAYVWADQRDRLERLRAAIRLTLDTGVKVERADAGEWVEAKVRPRGGAATVLYHSVVWQYLPPQTQDRIAAAVERAGLSATVEAPFAWLRIEPVRRAPTVEMHMTLTLWPGGETRKLAEVHAHGAWVAWTATL